MRYSRAKAIYSLSSLLTDERFPRSSAYDRAWLLDKPFGANVLWLAEWLSQAVTLSPGMRVLDLGCGRAKSSVFLAREFDIEVWAADLWIDPTENWRAVSDMGLADVVHPLRVDARNLPFPAAYFDGILAVDAIQYFGTDDLFLPYATQFLKPGGFIGFASAGTVRDMSHPVPAHLEQFWNSDAWSIRTAAWWRDHWRRTGLVEVNSADTMKDGWRLWLDWAEATECSKWYLETIKEDAGECLGYIRVVANKAVGAPDLPYDLRKGGDWW